MTHPLGRQPIGVNQPPGGGDHYPFVAPSDDVRYLLGDFYLSYADDALAYEFPFALAWLYGFGDADADNLLLEDGVNALLLEDGTPLLLGAPAAAPPGTPPPAHPRDVLVVDAAGRVVFDSTTATSYAETPWAGRLLVMEWLAGEQVCRCTMHTDWPPDVTPRSYPLNLVPAAGELDARTYARLPGRLRSLRVGGQVFGGQVLFQAGYNMALTPTPRPRTDGGRLATRLAYDATPGAGLGRLPGCVEGDPLVRRINGAGPDAGGNFTVTAGDCLRAQPAVQIRDDPVLGRVAVPGGYGLTAEEARAAVVLASTCLPCYDCSYFVRTYQGLRRQWADWQALAAGAESVRDTYAANLGRWEDQRACRAAHPARVVVAAGSACKGSVAGSYCNNTDACLAPLEMRFTFTLYRNGAAAPWPDAGVALVEAYVQGSATAGEERYAPAVTGPVFRFFFDYADPRQVSLVRFRLCVTCAAGDSLGVALTVHTSGPPVVAVPDELAGVWAAAGVPAGPGPVVVEVGGLPLDPAPAPAPECGC